MLKVSFDPFPVLRTERLRLRRVVSSDAECIYRLRSDANTMRYIARPLAQSIDDAREHVRLIDEKVSENTGINWAIAFPHETDLIGIIGLFRIEPENYRAELGYMLLPEYHNRGIISEAIKKVIEYGFSQMNLHSIEAIIDPENGASAKVLEKNGFVREAHLRENKFFNGKFLDTVIYSKLAIDR